MGCKCSKHEDKEVEDIYSKYAVKPKTNTTTNAITINNENSNTEGMIVHLTRSDKTSPEDCAVCIKRLPRYPKLYS